MASKAQKKTRSMKVRGRKILECRTVGYKDADDAVSWFLRGVGTSSLYPRTKCYLCRHLLTLSSWAPLILGRKHTCLSSLSS